MKSLLNIASATVMMAALSGCVTNVAVPKGFRFNKKNNDGILAFSVGCNLGNYSGGQIFIGTPNNVFGNLYQTNGFSCMLPNGNQDILTYISYKLPAGTYSVDGWTIPTDLNHNISDSFNKPFTFKVERNKVNYIGSIELMKKPNHHYEMIFTKQRLQTDFKYFYNYFPNISHTQYRFVKPVPKKRNWYND
ncbi:MAG TPA: hypothetical protein VJK30_04320 [Coxiellaceae bacterium]|nr:hypothetical protein [Coxiellaceae bacterium]